MCKIRKASKPEIVYGMQPVAGWDIEGGEIYDALVVTQEKRILVKSYGYPWVRVAISKSGTYWGGTGVRYKVPKEIEKIVSSCLPGNILLKCLVEDEEEVCVLEEEGIEGRE